MKPSSKPSSADPLDVNARLYRQVAALLDDLEAADLEERMTVPQRISALIAIGRLQIMFGTIRKGAFEDGSAGSTVRRYAKAFASQDGARRRAAGPVAVDYGDDDGDSGPDAA